MVGLCDLMSVVSKLHTCIKSFLGQKSKGDFQKGFTGVNNFPGKKQNQKNFAYAAEKLTLVNKRKRYSGHRGRICAELCGRGQIRENMYKVNEE